MTLSISASRPTRGSRTPSIAAWVKSRENSLSSGVSFGLASAWRSGPGQFLSDRDQTESALMEDFGCNAFLLTKNAEEKMLGTDVTVIQPFRFLVSIDENPLALVGERQ